MLLGAYDAFGVADFLPSIENGDELDAGGERLKEHPQVEFKEDSTISHLHPVRHQEIDSDKLANSFRMAESGISKGNGSQGGASRFNGNNGGINGWNDSDKDQQNGLGQEGKGSNRPSSDSNNHIHYLESVSRDTVTMYKYRLIERDANTGRYDLLLRSEQTIHNVKTVISVVGDSGNKSNISIQSAMINSANLRVNKNHIFIDTIPQGVWVKIAVKFKEPGRLKMEVDTYAVG